MKEKSVSDDNGVDLEEATRSSDEEALQTVEEDEDKLAAGICESLLEALAQLSHPRRGISASRWMLR